MLDNENVWNKPLQFYRENNIQRNPVGLRACVHGRMYVNGVYKYVCIIPLFIQKSIQLRRDNSQTE